MQPTTSNRAQTPDGTEHGAAGRRRLLGPLVLLIVTVATLGVLELALRLVGWPPAPSAPQSDLDGALDYGDTWREGGLGPGGYLKEGFAGRVRNGLGGLVDWRNNAQGFRHDRDTTLEPSPGTLRVLSLGDSFAAGYRVGQRETYSARLESSLSTELGRPVEVLISVIEEPATGLYYLSTYGRDFAPDVVLLGVTLGNDLSQVYLTTHERGDYVLSGDEPTVIVQNDRADPGAVVEHLRTTPLPAECLRNDREAPAGEEAETKWRLLRLARRALNSRATEPVTSTWPDLDPPSAFDGNGLGWMLRELPTDLTIGLERLGKVLRGYREVTTEIGAQLLVVLFPQRYQVDDGDWGAIASSFGLVEGCFSRSAANERILRFCGANGVTCFDPTAELRNWVHASDEAIYLPRGDMHWNATGHRALEEILRPWITSRLSAP